MHDEGLPRNEEVLYAILAAVSQQLTRAGFLEVPHTYSWMMLGASHSAAADWGVPTRWSHGQSEISEARSIFDKRRRQESKNQFYLPLDGQSRSLPKFGQRAIFYRVMLTGMATAEVGISVGLLGTPIVASEEIIVTAGNPLSDGDIAGLCQALKESDDDDTLLTTAALVNPVGLAEQRSRWGMATLRVNAEDALANHTLDIPAGDLLFASDTYYELAKSSSFKKHEDALWVLGGPSVVSAEGPWAATVLPQERCPGIPLGLWWQSPIDHISGLALLGERLAGELNRKAALPKWESVLVHAPDPDGQLKYFLFVGFQGAPWVDHLPLIVAGYGEQDEMTLPTRVNVVARWE